MSIQFKKEEMTSLTVCLQKLQEEGYTENFIAKDEGLEAESSKRLYSPPEVRITNFYRFEGESDPGDNSILYAIETEDGIKGTLVDAYGPYANRKVSHFIEAVEEIHKKEPPEAE